MTLPSKPFLFPLIFFNPFLAVAYNINAAEARMGLSNEAAEDLCPHHTGWGAQGVDLASLQFVCEQVFCLI